MGWIERQWKRVLQGSPATLIDAGSGFGISLLFESLASASPNFSWIRLEGTDDAVSIGSRISLAVEAAHGAVLFGTGMPYSYALNYLAGLGDDLGPQCLMVESAHRHVMFAQACLLASRRAQGRLRVVLAGSSSSQEWRDLVSSYSGHLISEDQLEMSETEWIATIESAGLDPSAEGLAFGTAPRSYEQLLAAMAGASGAPTGSASRSQQVSKADSNAVNASKVRADLGRLDAFATMVREKPEEARQRLGSLGDQFFGQGRMLDLKVLTTKLLADDANDPVSLYWWYQAHIALGEQARVEDHIASQVRRAPRRAPALTACFASAARPKDAMALASAALDELRVPETVASVAFLKILDGELEAGIQDLRSAHEGYRRAGHWHRAIQVGNSIGSAYVTLGDFESAVLWARRGLEELRQHEIREELVRLSTTNLLAYSQLLLGEHEVGLETLSTIKLPASGALPPTLEGLVTTLGDFAVAAGEYDQAVLHYQRVHDAYASRLPGYATRHLLRGLLGAGLLDKARAAVALAEEMDTKEDESESALVDLSRLILDATLTTPSQDRVSDLLERIPVSADAVARAELALHVASCWHRDGNRKLASDILQRELSVLARLGRSGWRLLTPPRTDIDALQSLVGLARGAPPRLEVLGSSHLERDGDREKVGRRYVELLTVLALRPEGLSGEALLLELYGESGSTSTLKSTISRARKYVEIDSSPYRLGETLSVDVVDLDSHLAKGDLHQALELYQGPLLPESEAPGIVRERERIDEALRQAVLMSGQQDLTLRLARKFQDDLELWEQAQELTPKDDPAYPLVRARVRRIRGEWGL